jgi:hypothetical protein
MASRASFVFKENPQIPRLRRELTELSRWAFELEVRQELARGWFEAV